MATQEPLDKVYRLIQECKKLDIDDNLANGHPTSTYQEEDMEVISEVYKIIKKSEKLKKSELHEENQPLAGSEKRFIDFCGSLTKDFMGVMRLYGKLDGRTHTVGLLLKKGNIIAASFEDVDADKVIFKEKAMSQIIKRLPGTKGDLKVCAFDDNDMKKAEEANKEALLKNKVSFSSLRLNVKSKVGTLVKKGNVETWTKETRIESFSRIKISKIKRLREEGAFNLADFARKLPKTGTSEEKQIGKRPELKKLQAEDEEIPMESEVADIEKSKVNCINISDIKKIETTMDKLYGMIQQRRILKINDQLASSLCVSRSKVEEWALILEKKKLVELRYPAFGEPEIKPILCGTKGEKETLDWVDGYVRIIK